jgi:hypothetical protein
MKTAAKVLANLPGFKKFGAFCIGTCNQDVISGYALDAPPGGVYVARFILPAYDRIDFLHMSLGGRIGHFSHEDIASGSADLALLLKTDWQDFSNVHDCRSLMAYLDRERIVGEYCQWARYLTHARIGDFEAAARVELEWKSSGPLRLQLITENVAAVFEAKRHSGWDGVQALLNNWSECAVTTFCQPRKIAKE